MLTRVLGTDVLPVEVQIFHSKALVSISQTQKDNDPNTTAALHVLSGHIALRAGKLDSALALINSSESLLPEDPYFFSCNQCNLGVLLGMMGHPLPAVQHILAAADHWNANDVSCPDNTFMFYDSHFAQLAVAAWYLPLLGRLDEARSVLQSYNRYVSSGSSRHPAAVICFIFSWGALSLLINQAYALTGEAVGMLRTLLRRDLSSAPRVFRALTVVESAIEVLAPQSIGPIAHPSPAGAGRGSGTFSHDSRIDSVASTTTALAALSVVAHAPRRELLCDEAPAALPSPSPPIAAAAIDGGGTTSAVTDADAAPPAASFATSAPSNPPLSIAALTTTKRKRESNGDGMFGDSDECSRRTALYLRILRFSMPDLYLVLMMEVQLRTRQWRAAATLLRMWEARRAVEEANSGEYQCELYRMRAELAAHELAQWQQRQQQPGEDSEQLSSMLSAVLRDYAGAVKLSTNAHMSTLAAKALLSLLLWLRRMGALPTWTPGGAVDTRFALRSMDELCVQPWCALLLTDHLCPWLSRHVPQEAQQRLASCNPSATADQLPSPLLPQRWCVWDTIQPSLTQDEVLRAHSAIATVCTLLSLVEASIPSAATTSPSLDHATSPVSQDKPAASVALGEASSPVALDQATTPVASGEVVPLAPFLGKATAPVALDNATAPAPLADVASPMPLAPVPAAAEAGEPVALVNIPAPPPRCGQAAPTEEGLVTASCTVPATASPSPPQQPSQPQHQQPLLSAAPIAATSTHPGSAASAPLPGPFPLQHCGGLQLTVEDINLLATMTETGVAEVQKGSSAQA